MNSGSFMTCSLFYFLFFSQGAAGCCCTLWTMMSHISGLDSVLTLSTEKSQCYLYDKGGPHQTTTFDLIGGVKAAESVFYFLCVCVCFNLVCFLLYSQCHLIQTYHQNETCLCLFSPIETNPQRITLMQSPWQLNKTLILLFLLWPLLLFF